MAREPAGVVCGTGFEDRPELIGVIARRWRLFGNTRRSLRARKTRSQRNSAATATSLIPSCRLPTGRSDRLARQTQRRRGRAAHPGTRSMPTPSPGRSTQRRGAGRPVRPFLADGRRVAVLGFSAQWSSPTPRQPFSTARRSQPPRSPRDRRRDHRGRAAAVPDVVRGLNSADFLVDESGIPLLEINPRPGATLDIFEPNEDPSSPCTSRRARVYCRRKHRASSKRGHRRSSMPSATSRRFALDWPAWTADRPDAGSSVAKGDPLCTGSLAAPPARQARRRSHSGEPR